MPDGNALPIDHSALQSPRVPLEPIPVPREYKTAARVRLPSGSATNLFHAPALGTDAHYSPKNKGIAVSDTLLAYFKAQIGETIVGWRNVNVAEYAVSHEATHMRWDTLSDGARQWVINNIFFNPDAPAITTALRSFASYLLQVPYYRGQGVSQITQVPVEDRNNWTQIALGQGGGDTRWYRKELLVNELLGYAAVPGANLDDATEKMKAVERRIWHQEQKTGQYVHGRGTVNTVMSALNCLQVVQQTDKAGKLQPVPEVRTLWGALERYNLVQTDAVKRDNAVLVQGIRQLVTSAS